MLLSGLSEVVTLASIVPFTVNNNPEVIWGNRLISANIKFLNQKINTSFLYFICFYCPLASSIQLINLVKSENSRKYWE